MEFQNKFHSWIWHILRNSPCHDYLFNAFQVLFHLFFWRNNQLVWLWVLLTDPWLDYIMIFLAPEFCRNVEMAKYYWINETRLYETQDMRLGCRNTSCRGTHGKINVFVTDEWWGSNPYRLPIMHYSHGITWRIWPPEEVNWFLSSPRWNSIAVHVCLLWNTLEQLHNYSSWMISLYVMEAKSTDIKQYFFQLI